MMKIGDFSLLTNVPVKTLRYYSDIGLLMPEKTDDTGYRYYSIRQLSKLNKILSLKESGFTLNEIISLSEKELSDEELLRTLKNKLETAIKEQRYLDTKIASIKKQINDLNKKKEPKMILKNLTAPPFNNTLMGTLKGVCDYYNLGYSEAMVYGGSGQAFMINIHPELCSSGPYVWNEEPYIKLAANLGVEIKDLGFFSEENTQQERIEVENTLKEHLASNNPCSLTNLEYQLITGYDSTGFLTSQPWQGDFPPSHLTFTTWDEFEDEIHACFYIFKNVEPKSFDIIFKKSLEHAVSIRREPHLHTDEPYVTGLQAYDVMAEAIENGYGSSHGAWWNPTVWGECRTKAADYMKEAADIIPKLSDKLISIADDYVLIGEGLNKVAEKGVAAKPKIELLKEIKKTEERALDKIEQLLKEL